MTKPIAPSVDTTRRTEAIPPEVFAAFNELIIKNWTGTAATFTQDAIVASVLARMPTTSRGEVFDNHWLDVESAYEAIGWLVHYDKPGYNESYPATFTFW